MQSWLNDKSFNGHTKSWYHSKEKDFNDIETLLWYIKYIHISKLEDTDNHISEVVIFVFR